MWRIVCALAASWLAILSPAAAAFDVVQLTNNSIDDNAADISGSKVVWHGRDGDYPVDYEIYMTTITEPNRVPSISFGGLALLGGLVLGIGVFARQCWQRRWLPLHQ